MAAAVIDRAWRESAPEQVEHDLGALWRELASTGTIARAVMSNLVVFRLHERRTSPRNHAPRADPPLEEVVARHPSRTIVIEHDRGEHDAAQPLGADVGITVFGPPNARYAVEQVVIRSACAEASLPSIVRRFVRGDLPTTVWWTEDASRVAPLARLVGMARQILYDSRSWRNVRDGVRAMAPFVANPEIDLADINWRRLTPLRTAIAHAARTATRPVAPADVRIAYRPGDRALAWLCAGWLASQLRWPAGEWPAIEELKRDDFLSIRCGEITGSLDDHRALVQPPGAAPFIVSVPRAGDAEAIAAELRTLTIDRVLQGAMDALVRQCAIS